MSTEEYLPNKTLNSSVLTKEQEERREFLKAIAALGLTAATASTLGGLSVLIRQKNKETPELVVEPVLSSVDVWKTSRNNQNPDVERKLRIAQELFGKEREKGSPLLYKERAERIAKVDLAWSGVQIESRESLESYLAEKEKEKDEGRGLAKQDRNIKTVEFYMSILDHERFIANGVEPVGWLARHMDYMNYLCIDNNLKTRMDISSVILVNDKLAKALKDDVDFWLPGKEKFPGGAISRWVVTPGHDPTVGRKIEFGAYYNKELDLDNGLMHELGHYAFNLSDLYFNDLTSANTTFDKSKWPQEMVNFSYSPRYLMAGSHVTQLFSPFSVSLLKEVEDSNISNRSGWYNYMMEEALNEIGDTKLSFGKELAAKEVSVYEAKSNGMAGPWTLNRRFERDPDTVLTIDRAGEAVLPREITSGYAHSYPRDDYEGVVSFGKNFILEVGNKYAHLNSFDLLSNHWENSQ